LAVWRRRRSGAGGVRVRTAGGGVYHNTCAVLDADGAYLGKYRKMLFRMIRCITRNFNFAPGDLGFLNFDTKYARIGIQICWDQWYPEGSRLTAMQGAQLIFIRRALGGHPHEKGAVGAAQLDSWKTIQRAHAIANGCFVAVVNPWDMRGNRRRRSGD